MQRVRIVLQLSRENLILARAEAESLFPKAKALEPELLLVEGSELLLKRMVMTRYAGKLLSETNSFEGLNLPTYKSFAVRVSKIGKADSQLIIREVAEKINGKVDLDKPEKIIRVFTNGKTHWVTEELYEYSAKSFAERDVNARPVFHPTSLKPKIARLLLNLSGVTKGVILDPFCGVGGILLEAADFGLRATGIEISEEYAEGARENAWFYWLDKRITVENEDFLKWKGGRFDAIVTDLPYGKSSSLFGRSAHNLYSNAFEKMKKHSNKAVIMAQEDLTPLLKKAGWRITKKFDFYVHKGMRRHIHVCSL